MTPKERQEKIQEFKVAIAKASTGMLQEMKKGLDRGLDNWKDPANREFFERKVYENLINGHYYDGMNFLMFLSRLPK